MDLFQRTPLFYAAMAGNVQDIYHCCVKLANNPNCFDIFGLTPLHYALQNIGNQDLCYAAVDCLLNCGANPNCHKQGDFTPLMLATIRHNGQIIQRLVAAGADLNARYTKPDSHSIHMNSTAIHIAIRLNFQSIATQLLQYQHSPEIIQEIIHLCSQIVADNQIVLIPVNPFNNQLNQPIQIVGSDCDEEPR
jgi:ankyrin repeat protein